MGVGRREHTQGELEEDKAKSRDSDQREKGEGGEVELFVCSFFPLAQIVLSRSRKVGMKITLRYLHEYVHDQSTRYKSA